MSSAFHCWKSLLVGSNIMTLPHQFSISIILSLLRCTLSFCLSLFEGGLRLVTPPNSDKYAQESSRQFDEAYGLSFAQQLKNKVR